MFMISFPLGFKVGDTVDCRINREPARVTWRDANHLVIEPDDARVIVAIDKDHDLINFVCGDANTEAQEYQVDTREEFAGAFIVSGPKGDKP